MQDHYNARYNHLDDSARYLTCLSLSGCKFECSQSCVFSASLVELHLVRAQLLRFHDQGVAACSNLEKESLRREAFQSCREACSSLHTLSCSDAVVGATNAAYTLNLQSQSCITPANLPLLTALTVLVIEAEDWECEGQTEFSWLVGLTTLHQAMLYYFPYKMVVLQSDQVFRHDSQQS